MDPILCSRCDDAEVETEGAICAACVAQMNEDAGIDARSRLNQISSVFAEIEEFTEPHGLSCDCMACALRRDTFRLLRSLERPGWDSLMADGWRAAGLRPWGIEEERHVH